MQTFVTADNVAVQNICSRYCAHSNASQMLCEILGATQHSIIMCIPWKVLHLFQQISVLCHTGIQLLLTISAYYSLVLTHFPFKHLSPKGLEVHKRHDELPFKDDYFLQNSPVLFLECWG